MAGREVVLDRLTLTTLPIARLGTPIAAMIDEESRAKIVRAMDELLSQA